MNKTTILYIDDDINSFVEDFLQSYCASNNLIYQYYEFDSDIDSFESMIKKTEVQVSDILIIDSILFKNNSINKFNGEELALLIKKIFPFKILQIVSKNVLDDDYKSLTKYNSRNEEDATSFFETYWKPSLDNSVKEIKQYKSFRKKINNNNSIDSLIKSRINQSFEGITDYDNLTSADINKCIQSFEEIKELLRNE